MKIVYNKLIRDNIPEIIEKDNKTCVTRILGKEEYLECLKEKLLEEGNEVKAASNKEEMIKEIADVLEVIDGIKDCLDISDEEIQSIKEKKAISNGAFKKRLFLEYVEEK